MLYNRKVKKHAFEHKSIILFDYNQFIFISQIWLFIISIQTTFSKLTNLLKIFFLILVVT